MESGVPSNVSGRIPKAMNANLKLEQMRNSRAISSKTKMKLFNTIVK